MVMLKLGPGITDINGKIKGEYYRRDACAQHLQFYPYLRRYVENPQQRAFRRCKNAWMKYEWPQTELDLWWIWCEKNPIDNKKGEIRYLHPYLAFLSVNIKRVMLGLDIIYIPPLD